MTNLPLLVHLQRLDEDLFQRARAVRTEVAKYLRYVPATFAHYTDHSIEHSDEIIKQLGQLVLHDGDPGRPTLDLSAAEAYVLVIASYLHDAGMVVSEAEKIEVLGSEAWAEFVKQPFVKDRWLEAQSVREASEPEDVFVRHYLADLETRFLLAEFYRGRHSGRARAVVYEHEQQLGNFARGEPILMRTISDVCTGHGLRRYELDDTTRFPFRRDVLGYKVNVRLLAVLLRLGDLLDLRYQRACPLLMGPASPLPRESMAHWTQYSAIDHLMVAPDRIEVHASCHNHEEHRILRDWMEWLVQELEGSSELLARSTRHEAWRRPHARLAQPDPTIIIEPVHGAKYRPVEWRFELDSEAVIERFVKDAYTSKWSFLRELLQNALDATRVRALNEYRSHDARVNSQPNLLPIEVRQRFPLKVALQAYEASGGASPYTTLRIEDLGTGMTEDVIRKYLLQIGRSYYATTDFLQRYSFTPTSRFGIGFLSVFGVSDEVTVDTFDPGNGGEPLRLTLTGPRSYLLLERSDRATQGTTVEVKLRGVVEAQEIEAYLADTLPFVEFEVRMEAGNETFAVSSRSFLDPPPPQVLRSGDTVLVESVPVASDGLFGALYVQSCTGGSAAVSWAGAHIAACLDADPLSEAPQLPEPYLCHSGITRLKGLGQEGLAARVDVRAKGVLEPEGLLRNVMQGSWVTGRELRGLWRALVLAHLKTSEHNRGPDAWRYLQQIAERFDFLGDDFWLTHPNFLLLRQGSEERLFTLSEAAELPSLVVLRDESQASYELVDRAIFQAKLLGGERDLRTRRPLYMPFGKELRDRDTLPYGFYLARVEGSAWTLLPHDVISLASATLRSLLARREIASVHFQGRCQRWIYGPVSHPSDDVPAMDESRQGPGRPVIRTVAVSGDVDRNILLVRPTDRPSRACFSRTHPLTHLLLQCQPSEGSFSEKVSAGAWSRVVNALTKEHFLDPHAQRTLDGLLDQLRLERENIPNFILEPTPHGVVARPSLRRRP